MDVKIYPSKLDGILSVPPSKSVAHRALICAALSDRPTKIFCALNSADVFATADCLNKMGANVDYKDGIFSVTPIKEFNTSADFNVKESGSTLRFLLPVCSAIGGTYRFNGEGKLPDRPIKDLMLSLEEISFSQDKLPFIASGKLSGGRYEIKGNVSSQYISGLLMALPLLNEDSEIIIKEGFVSESYINLTLSVLFSFGIFAVKTENGFKIYGNQRYRSPETFTVEGDYSSAAFFIGASAFGNRVKVEGLNAESFQGDKVITKMLLSFNAKGTTLDVKDCPDLVPILTVCACYSCSKTEIINAERLREKESDRLTALRLNLNKLGAFITETEKGLIIEGKGGLEGGETVDSFSDHRIAMAMAMAGTCSKNPIIIKNAGAVDKSYANFFDDFIKLGGKCDVL